MPGTLTGTLSGALLVAGTTSDAGKSVLTAGICRWLARQGVRVAPFKAQNMSLNSTVTADGAEIGRAQAMQAAAAGVAPEAAMNPVLLKPGADHTSQVVVLGRPDGEVTALSYRARKAALLEVSLDCLADLRRRFDVVVCEGAGSPAEINLRATDIANMGLARAANLPTVVVGDIDRGGVFAALYGTTALLSAEDQALICGYVVNRFRGDQRLLEPGLDALTAVTGRPVLGVIPHLDGLELDTEDSLGLPPAGAVVGRGQDALAAPLMVAVVRLPRISNATDCDALAAEPGVAVRYVDTPAGLDGADLIVLPGSRATVADLAWLRERGLADALRRSGSAILGICGGYQMLGRTITDDVESRAGRVDGLGLLPLDIVFGREKVLARPTATAYEIHHGIAHVDAGAEPFPGGCRSGPVMGTVWHGLLEDDAFRKGLLEGLGTGFVADPATSFAAVRERRLDVLGDAVADHLDTAALLRLIEQGAPAGLRVLPPGAPL